MRIRVREASLHATDCTARIPFRFGASTLTWAPLSTARVLVETADGDRVEGFSSDLMVPRWFDKDPNRTIRDDIEGLVASARSAVAAMTAPALPFLTPFELWWSAYANADTGPERGLVAGFGVALLERAMLDAVCRIAGVSFFQALRQDLFTFEPGVVHAELSSWDCAASLPARPRSRVRLRHTVGLLDPLRVTDIDKDARVRDGFPQALEEDVRRYGLTCFKIKLGGEPRIDTERLVQVARVLRELGADDDVLITLDGNEQYDDLEALEGVLANTYEDRDGEWLVDAIRYVEQPLSRAASFDPKATAAIRTCPFPVILDEADYGTAAFGRAIEIGYHGISVKNCKGVFRSLLNRGLCQLHDRFQSAEDLTNLPVLALQQDLTLVAALGLEHVERNGHHYFRGLEHLPPEEAQEALRKHPDLYTRGPSGIALKIEGGMLSLGSLQVPGFGYDVKVNLDARTPLDDWRIPEA